MNHPTAPPNPTSDTTTEQPPNPRLLALESKRATLAQTLADLKAERQVLASSTPLPSGLSMPTEWSDEEKLKHATKSSDVVIKEHITHLHRYNEIKDIAQGLIGLIAEKRGVRVVEAMKEFGVEDKD